MSVPLDWNFNIVAVEGKIIAGFGDLLRMLLLPQAPFLKKRSRKREKDEDMGCSYFYAKNKRKEIFIFVRF